MSSARALRYRRLALTEVDKGKSDLLLKLVDECDRGFSAPLNGVPRRLPGKLSRGAKSGKPQVPSGNH
jgi:hypothetical protein